MLINELSAIVCSADSRRVDKTTVLEQAIQFLQQHQGKCRTVGAATVMLYRRDKIWIIGVFSDILEAVMDITTQLKHYQIFYGA